MIDVVISRYVAIGGGIRAAVTDSFRAGLIVMFASLFPLVDSSSAQIISTATGAHMAGGKVTVTFFGGPMATGTIMASGTTGTATFPGSFLFTVAGETSVAEWTLTNLDSGPAARSITSVVIDLMGSQSLFDDGSLPSTPLSLGGVAGASYLSGPAIASSGELAPWADPANLGDMFRAESVGWGGFMVPAIVPGGTAKWRDDTDLIPIPEPTSAGLLVAGALVAIALYRHTALA
ncbi:MAG: hypothetical protein WD851_09285 [Pirellulales bacterium]